MRADAVGVSAQKGEEMEIYKTRYQARKHAYFGEVVVKVDAGNGDIGYTIMSAADYRIWRNQK